MISDFNSNDLNQTPRANRLHIGIFGRMNVGKSSLINALTNQKMAIVSNEPGTTTDPVYRAMEIHGIGPVTFIDTAGLDEASDSALGIMRVEKTFDVIARTDLAILVLSKENTDFTYEINLLNKFKEKNIKTIIVINKADLNKELIIPNEIAVHKPILVSSLKGEGIEKIIEAILRNIPEDYEKLEITQGINERDKVLLVMPQDIQAPKGRLILPQVQTIRELLDKNCLVTCVTTDMIDLALNNAVTPYDYVITDSQFFDLVSMKVNTEETALTSFSVLFAGYKGDIDYFKKGAEKIKTLKDSSKILIAEACNHAPMYEDIGRVKIPRALKNKIGPNLVIDMVSGVDFPEDISEYSLIIHCGACMFNRKYVMSRIERAKSEGIPMTNYGLALAELKGVSGKISLA